MFFFYYKTHFSHCGLTDFWLVKKNFTSLNVSCFLLKSFQNGDEINHGDAEK